jgi:hypothetical protein
MNNETNESELPTLQEIKARHEQIIADMRAIWPDYSRSYIASDYSDVLEFTDRVLDGVETTGHSPLQIVSRRISEMQHYVAGMLAATNIG